MKKFFSGMLAVAIVSLISYGLYMVSAYLWGEKCDECNGTIIGTTYHIEGTDKEICESCAQWYDGYHHY